MRYQVKWMQGTTPYYGIYVDPQYEKRQPVHNHSFVDDAVLPVRYEIETSRLEDIEPAYENEFAQYVKRRYELDRKRSDEAATMKHKLFSIPVGDGLAYYMITRVHGVSIRVEWRGYNLDRWQCPVLGRGGKFPRERIEAIVRREDAMNALSREESA